MHGESKPEFLNKMPGFNKIIWIWQAAGLLIINLTRIQTKFNDVVAKFKGAKKWAKVHKSVTTLVSEEWLDKVYNTCKCEIFEKPKYLTTRFHVAADGKIEFRNRS